MNRRPFVIALAAVVLAAYGWHCLAVSYVVDDAFITFRYARNFVAGNGLVYNLGERVEGYTNFFWAMLLSGLVWIKPTTDFLPLAQALGVTFGAATIALVVWFSVRLHGTLQASSLVAAAFLAANSSFCAWSTSGLETTLFTFLVFAASVTYLAALDAQRVLLLPALLFAMAALTRPEGVVFFAAASVHLVITEMRARRHPVSARTVVWIAGFAVVCLPHLLWRVAYYGEWVPNTFHAKVGAGLEQYRRGIRYIVEYLRNYGWYVFLPPFALLWRRRQRWVDFFVLQVCAYGAYVVYVGGDGLAFFRFIVPIAPFVYLLVQEGALELYRRLHERVALRWVAPVSATLLLAAAVGGSARQTLPVLLFPDTHRWYEPQSELTFPMNAEGYTWFDNYFVDRLATAARWLDAHAPADAVVAATPAGAIGYYTNLRVIDMLGLTDAHIARAAGMKPGTGRAGHEKGDGRYVLSRSPEYILLGNVAVLPRPLDDSDMARKLVQTSEHQIWAEPEFHRQYERVTVRLSDRGPFQYFTFFKKRDGVGVQGSHDGE